MRGTCCAMNGPDATALLHLNERQPLQEVSWEELGGKVRIVATQLRKLGVKAW